MGRRLGLIIGINQYQHAAFQPLQFAENDAKALAQWLVNTRGGNWVPSDLQLVLGSQATYELAASLFMQICVNEAEPGDLVFIYFAGHAFVDEASGDGYLAFVSIRLRARNSRAPTTVSINATEDGSGVVPIIGFKVTAAVK